jgi:hypothetical protein
LRNGKRGLLAGKGTASWAERRGGPGLMVLHLSQDFPESTFLAPPECVNQKEDDPHVRMSPWGGV